MDTKKLRTVKITGVSEIKEATFAECGSVRQVTLGKEIKKIGEECFRGCKNLRKVVVQSRKKIIWKIMARWMNKIKPDTFKGCKKLKNVYLKSKKADRTIKGVFPKKVTLHVPKCSRMEYRKKVRCKVA